MMNTNRPFRWLESIALPHDRAAKGRHAYPADSRLVEGDEVTAICGAPTVIHQHKSGREGPYPQCAGCDRVWRDAEGISSVYDQPAGQPPNGAAAELACAGQPG